jgi:hypothetical protein
MLPSPHPSVVFRTVSDGAVLLHTELEIYFGLNSVGSRVWQLLPPGCRNLDELCTSLRRSYPDVADDELRADVVELLGQLRENLLVVETW